MTTVKAMRNLMAKATPGPWQPPHYSTAKKKGDCHCVYVLCDSLMGSVCDISIEEHKRNEDGWGDNPPPKQARANGLLIASMRNALPALLAVVEAAQSVIKAGSHEELNGAHDRLEAVLDALETQ